MKIYLAPYSLQSTLIYSHLILTPNLEAKDNIKKKASKCLTNVLYIRNLYNFLKIKNKIKI